jgi:protein involved in polysaccharide export with SLBB domain
MIHPIFDVRIDLRERSATVLCRERLLAAVNMLRGPRAVALSLAASGLLAAAGGCKSLADQSELVRHESDKLVVPILSSIDPIDEADVEFAGAQDVRAGDLEPIVTDYVIGPNDLITVTVEDPLAQGIQTVRTVRVSETGTLTLPQLPNAVRASGLTERELQAAVAQAYKDAQQILNAQVTAQVVEARGRTFSITGAIGRPGQYVILKSDFRLLDALVQAGDTTAPIDTAYVLRKLRSEQPSTRPANGTDATTRPAVDPLAPPPGGAQGNAADPQPVLAVQAADTATGTSGQPAADDRYIFIDGKAVPLRGGQPATQPVGAGAEGPLDPLDPRARTAEPPADDFQFGDALVADQNQRVIRVPLRQLRSGDFRYNIVIRPDDMIIIPLPESGFYYMGGHVASGGVFSLTGIQKVTLKQAIVATRMLDPLAVPWKTDIIRRLGNSDREIYVRVDLNKIFDGRQPDFYLKPNDTILVGTDFWPPYLAALRGAFRFSYGLGFIYDRNFAPQQEQDQ